MLQVDVDVEETKNQQHQHGEKAVGIHHHLLLQTKLEKAKNQQKIRAKAAVVLASLARISPVSVLEELWCWWGRLCLLKVIKQENLLLKALIIRLQAL